MALTPDTASGSSALCFGSANFTTRFLLSSQGRGSTALQVLSPAGLTCAPNTRESLQTAQPSQHCRCCAEITCSLLLA